MREVASTSRSDDAEVRRSWPPRGMAGTMGCGDASVRMARHADRGLEAAGSEGAGADVVGGFATTSGTGVGGVREKPANLGTGDVEL